MRQLLALTLLTLLSLSAPNAPAGASFEADPAAQIYTLGEGAQLRWRRVGHREPDAWWKKQETELAHMLSETLPATVRLEPLPCAGFIADASGLVVSNAYCVANIKVDDEVKVKMYGQPALTVGRLLAKEKDIAILQLPEREGDWPTLPLADASAIQLGARVIALGSSPSLEWRITRGIVRSIGRYQGRYKTGGGRYFIQTDAAIHLGSGGPLLNMLGEVIGLTTSKVLASRDYETLASDEIQRALEPFIRKSQGRKAARAGMYLEAREDQEGLRVVELKPEGSAAQAGLRVGDVIVEIDGQKLPKDSAEALESAHRLVMSKSPGEELSLLIRRDGVELRIHLVFGAARFVHPQGDYILEYPSDWQREVGLQAVYVHPPGQFVEVSVERYPISRTDPPTAADYMHSRLRRAEVSLGLEKLESQKTVKVSGLTAERLEFVETEVFKGPDGQPLPGPLHAIEIVMPRQKAYYVLRLRAIGEAYVKALPEFENIVAKFRLHPDAD